MPRGDAAPTGPARTALAAFLHLIFPTPCHVCGKALDAARRSALCGACWERLERMPAAGCHRCGWPLPGPGGLRGVEEALCQRCRETADHFRTARAVLVYRDGGLAREAILLAKHGGRPGLLAHLADLLAEEAPAHLAPAAWDAVVPVPLHWSRRWRRGYNQAEILARGLHRRHGLPLLRALVRTRPTPPQHGDAAERRRNVRGAFAVRRRAAVAGRRLLLVDDVFTTGATANGCAMALLGAGAADVGVLTLARVEWPDPRRRPAPRWF
jgi:ComF family protein